VLSAIPCERGEGDEGVLPPERRKNNIGQISKKKFMKTAAEGSYARDSYVLLQMKLEVSTREKLEE
jgi:hypothetical protein